MAAKDNDEAVDVIVIKPPGGYARINLREIWCARYMLWNLIKRNAKIPYVDLKFGIFWTLVRPLLFVLVIVFIKRASQANMQEGVAYTLYLYSGLIIWWYFSDAVIAATQSIYSDAGILTKVYYPRIISPVAPVAAGLLDLLIQMTLLPLGMLIFGHYPDWRILLLPVVLLHMIVLSLGMGLIFASLTIEYRDFTKILSYVLYVGMFLSPVLYSPRVIPENYQGLYYIVNPVAAPIEMFRAALFADAPAPWNEWLISGAVAVTVLGLGMHFFKQLEVYVADRAL